MIAAVVEHIIALAREAGATVVESRGAIVVVIPTATATDPDEHLSLDAARGLGKLGSIRQIKEAGRAGVLALYGAQRSRTVKRGEFMAWLETRRAPVVLVASDQAARVELRLGKRRSTGSSRRGAA